MNNNLIFNKIINNKHYIKINDYITTNKDNLNLFYTKNKNDIKNNPDILNPLSFPINSNKIFNKEYSILYPYKIPIINSTLLFYILFSSIFFFAIIKYVNIS